MLDPVSDLRARVDELRSLPLQAREALFAKLAGDAMTRIAAQGVDAEALTFQLRAIWKIGAELGVMTPPPRLDA